MKPRKILQAKKPQKIMDRRDIPYAQRLQMKKDAEIYHHRDDAARTVMQLACIALNDTEKMGLTRLTRFSNRLHELVKEYYKDRDVGDVHVKQRLEEMGFRMDADNRLHAYLDQDDKPVRAEEAERILEEKKHGKKHEKLSVGG